MLKTKGFIEPKGSKRDFEGGIFWDGLNVHTFNCLDRADRRVKGWLRRDGWAEGWVDGWFAKVDNVFLRLGGFAKVDNRFGLILSLQGGCIGWFH